MKSSKVPLRSQLKSNKFLFKSHSLQNKHAEQVVKNAKRLRIVQSVRAGHVRGGHSFH